MEFETLIVERLGAILRVAINREAKRNAVNDQVHEDLRGAITDRPAGRTLEELGDPLEVRLAQHSTWVATASAEGRQLDVSGFDMRAAGGFDAVNLTVAPMIAGGDEQRIITGAPAATTGLSIVHAFAQGDHLFTRWEQTTPDR